MKITDLHGCKIEVTDLDEAIKMTAVYKELRSEDKTCPEFYKRQKAYWADMYEKLTTIKKETTTH